MATQKQQLIDGIVNLIEESGTKISMQDVEFLEQQNVQWLIDYYKKVYAEAVETRKSNETKKLLDKVIAEARAKFERDNAEADEAKRAESENFYRDYAFSQVGKVVIGGRRVVLNDGTTRLIESWVNPGESLNAEWFIRVLKEQPSLADQLQWRSASVDQNAVDRETFSQAARQFRVSDNIANFNLVRQTAGEGFSVYQVQHIDGLSPASQQEIDNWNAETVAERQDFLINRATPDQLKAAAREESAEQRAHEEQQQASAAFEATRQRDAVANFPALPVEISSTEIRNASAQRLKYLLKRFGTHQVNLRLNGRG
jgi:hypothetical protein